MYILFKMHLEHVPGQITCYATKIGSKNLRRLKSYQASIPTMTLKQEINYKKTGKNKQDHLKVNTTLLKNL